MDSFFPVPSSLLLGPLCLLQAKSQGNVALHLAQLYQSANFSDLLLTKIQPVIAQLSAFPAHYPCKIK